VFTFLRVFVPGYVCIHEYGLGVLFFVRFARSLSVDSMRRVTVLGNGTLHSFLSLHAAQTGVGQYGSC